MSEKALVVGGAGFLGSHVADELSDRGYSVTVFDHVPSRWIRPDQRMLVGDMLDEQAVAAACADVGYVFHFAGFADLDASHDNPRATVLQNILGTVNVLEASRAAGVKRVVFASTVYVYSRAGSFYRASKQACEAYIELFHERFQLPFTILRFGSLYGRRADSRNTIHAFIEGALRDGVIRYRGGGDELREYIHVFDAAKASVDVLVPQFENAHLVVTGHQAMRVRDVMRMIAEMLEAAVECRFDSEVGGDHYAITPYSYAPRIGRKLVVNPFVDTGQGILDCIREIDESLHHLSSNPR